MAEFFITLVAMSSFLSPEARVELKQLLTKQTDEVKIILFTQEMPCQTCADQRRLLEEVAGMSPKIKLTILDIVKDGGRARERGGRQGPCDAHRRA